MALTTLYSPEGEEKIVHSVDTLGWLNQGYTFTRPSKTKVVEPPVETKVSEETKVSDRRKKTPKTTRDESHKEG